MFLKHLSRQVLASVEQPEMVTGCKMPVSKEQESPFPFPIPMEMQSGNPSPPKKESAFKCCTFTLFKNDLGNPGNAKVRTELLYIGLA